MVEEQLLRRDIAMSGCGGDAKVPRHGSCRPVTCRGILHGPLSIGTADIFQPYIVASMTQRWLSSFETGVEIGTGSGYKRWYSRSCRSVYSIEIFGVASDGREIIPKLEYGKYLDRLATWLGGRNMRIARHHRQARLLLSLAPSRPAHMAAGW